MISSFLTQIREVPLIVPLGNSTKTSPFFCAKDLQPRNRLVVGNSRSVDHQTLRTLRRLNLDDDFAWVQPRPDFIARRQRRAGAQCWEKR